MFFCVNGPQSISSWRYQYMELSWCWKFPFSVMLGVIVCKTPQGMFLAVGWQPLTFLALGNIRLGSCSHVVWGWAVGAAWVTLEVADPPQTPATSGTGCARAGEIMEDVWMFLLKAAAGDERNQHTQNVGPQTPQIPNLKWTEWKRHLFPIFLLEVAVSPGAACSPLIIAFQPEEFVLIAPGKVARIVFFEGYW